MNINSQAKRKIMNNNCKSNILYQILSLLLLALIVCMVTGKCCQNWRDERFMNKIIDRRFPAPEAAAPAAPARAEQAAGYVVHTVARGETLFTIAHSYTGDGQMFREIARFNNINPNAVEIGDVIKIPESLLQ